MKARRHSILIFSGAVLVAASLPHLAPILQEVAAVRDLRGEWSIERLALEAGAATRGGLDPLWTVECEGHRMAVGDTLPFPRSSAQPGAGEAPPDAPAGAGAERVTAPVTIEIDGARFRADEGIEIRPAQPPPDRYWTWLAAFRLTSVDGDRVVCGIVHRLPFSEEAVARARERGEADPHLFGYRFRVITVEGDRPVAEERFAYADIGEEPSRALVANLASPTPLGITSQALSVWPTVFYPLIYPVGTALLGLALAGLGAATLPRSQDSS